MIYYSHFPPKFAAVVVIRRFIIGVNVWWEYLAPRNIPSTTAPTQGYTAVL